MGSRRRSYIVLGLVLVLIIASVYAITSKPTRQGIDLAGGTELVYEARATGANTTINVEDVDRSVDLIRERVDALGVSEPEISRIGERQISVSLPEVQNAQDAIDQVGQTSQLSFYDFEPNVVPPDPDITDAVERPFNRLYDAVIASQKEKPECFEKDGEALCTHDGLYYLFDENSLELLAGPVSKEEDLYLKFDGEQPEGSVVEEVPQGYVVLREEAPPDDPATDADESETGIRGWFLLKDRPELTGDDIRNPEQNFDPVSNVPNVTFDFTDKGQESFAEVTQRIAQRGLEKAGIQGQTIDAEQAAGISDSFAVVLDGEIVSRPIINFKENPTGISGDTGAQISGDFTITEAQDLAEFLRIGALPVELALINQSTVSATLGQDALDGAIKAALFGLALVVVFLLAYYRFLGFVALLGLAVYALFYLAMIKIIPITLTLPGIAGLILTIGVAADSNIVIFERIKEELHLGRSTLSAIAQGYRKGIATIVDANVITLLTAFILFVLASAGVKGFAFTLGIGTIVSLFTAVLFTQAFLAVMGRSPMLRSARFLGAGEDQKDWKFDFTGRSKYFFSASGVILMIGAVAFSTQQLNLGIDFESGTRITAALAEDASAEDVRTALNDAGIDGIDSAEIQSVENEDFGANVIQMQAKIPPDQATGGPRGAERRLRARGRRPGLPERIRRADVRPAGRRERGQGADHVAARDLGLCRDQVRGEVRGAGSHRPLPRHPHHRGHLRADGAGGDERDRGCLPHHLGLFDVRHDHRVRQDPRERAAHAARRLLPDREPLDGRGPHAFAHHRPLDRLPGRHDPRLRRRDPARLRLRDDGRDRLRYVLVDLHRRARPD